VDRCYFVSEPTVERCSLRGFCDASLKAYIAVVYLLIETKNGTVTRFIASKSRLAPLSNQTVPMLELLSCILLARLMATVFSAVEPEICLEKPVYYSDSQVALCWIKCVTKQWNQFIENRVRDIRKISSVDFWRHCKSEDNSADIPSRGSSLESLRG
jgi:hypothetical protein